MLVFLGLLYGLIALAFGIVSHDNEAKPWEVLVWALFWPAILWLIGLMIIWDWVTHLRRY